MGLKITVDIDTLGDDGKAEALRGLVFDQRYDEYGVWLAGCYGTFDVRPGFEKIDPHKYPKLFDNIDPCDENIRVFAYENPEIVAMWYWDGDGELLLWVKGEDYAYLNTDCKCDYNWQGVRV